MTTLETPQIFTSIRSFKNITVIPNSLMVLDIDETVLKYNGVCKKWRDERYDFHFKHTGSKTMTDQLCIEDWKETMKTQIPVHTDEDGFFNLIQRANSLNCKIILVTARDLKIKDITHEHLDYLNIAGIEVHFASGANKGVVIDRIIADNSETYKIISFVDDMEYNLKDVKEYFGDKVICYKFEMDHECS